MSVYENIAAGKYANRTPYPERPKKPSTAKADVGTMTQDDFDRYKREQTEYANALKRYNLLVTDYNRGVAEAIALFWADVAEDYGIPPDDPFFAAMQGIAWDRGHGSGLNDVWGAFDDLLPLWELYVKAKG